MAAAAAIAQKRTDPAASNRQVSQRRGRRRLTVFGGFLAIRSISHPISTVKRIILKDVRKFKSGGFLVEPKSCFHAGAFGTRWSAIASICRRPASLDLGLAFRWRINRARRQMRGDRIKCLGLRTYRTSCINATDSICRRARMESQSVVKLGQWARVDDKSNRSRSAGGNATCGTFQHFRIAPHGSGRVRMRLSPEATRGE